MHYNQSGESNETDKPVTTITTGLTHCITRMRDDRMSKRDPMRAGDMLRSVKIKPPVEIIDGRIIVGQLKRRSQQRHLQISYVITVPKHSDVIAHSTSGDVQVSGISGNVNASSEPAKVVRAETNDDADKNDRA